MLRSLGVALGLQGFHEGNYKGYLTGYYKGTIKLEGFGA